MDPDELRVASFASNYDVSRNIIQTEPDKNPREGLDDLTYLGEKRYREEEEITEDRFESYIERMRLEISDTIRNSVVEHELYEFIQLVEGVTGVPSTDATAGFDVSQAEAAAERIEANMRHIFKLSFESRNRKRTKYNQDTYDRQIEMLENKLQSTQDIYAFVRKTMFNILRNVVPYMKELKDFAEKGTGELSATLSEQDAGEESSNITDQTVPLMNDPLSYPKKDDNKPGPLKKLLPVGERPNARDIKKIDLGIMTEELAFFKTKIQDELAERLSFLMIYPLFMAMDQIQNVFLERLSRKEGELNFIKRYKDDVLSGGKFATEGTAEDKFSKSIEESQRLFLKLARDTVSSFNLTENDEDIHPDDIIEKFFTTSNFISSNELIDSVDDIEEGAKRKIADHYEDYVVDYVKANGRDIMQRRVENSDALNEFFSNTTPFFRSRVSQYLVDMYLTTESLINATTVKVQKLKKERMRAFTISRSGERDSSEACVESLTKESKSLMEQLKEGKLIRVNSVNVLSMNEVYTLLSTGRRDWTNEVHDAKEIAKTKNVNVRSLFASAVGTNKRKKQITHRTTGYAQNNHLGQVKAEQSDYVNRLRQYVPDRLRGNQIRFTLKYPLKP